jgi:hypothetical protein
MLAGEEDGEVGSGRNAMCSCDALRKGSICDGFAG